MASKTMHEDEVAITGISGRFPSCATMEQLQEALLEGTDLITENHPRWPHHSMDLPSRMGLVQDLHLFDAAFFGINPKQAEGTDPRMRKLLEVVFEAIFDAGVNPMDLRGSDTGVFLAVTQNSYPNGSPKNINSGSYSPTSSGIFTKSTAIMANTISFCFDFKGPSYALDTGCSSSLYALAQAMDAINSGSCESAIVCSAQLHLDPLESLEFKSLGVLTMDGNCRAFDKGRDGYVKSEAVTAVLLQKSSAARRIYSTIAGVGTNVDGFKSEGLVHPSHAMQEELLDRTYMKYGIDPDEVGYIEAHGTGTIVGDREEAQAILDFYFGTGRKRELLVGAVKSNLGHSETASGLVSLAKVVTAVHSGIIPGNLHFREPAPDVPGIHDGRLVIVDKNTPLPPGLVAINSFGFGGANAHVILRPFLRRNNLPGIPPILLNSPFTATFTLPRLVQVSGRTAAAVTSLLERVNSFRSDPETLAFLAGIFGRPVDNHNFRGYAVLGKAPRLEVAKVKIKNRPIWFVYSGMGSQWPGMARDLMKMEAFRRTMRRCAEAVKPFGVDLEELVVNGRKEDLEDVVNCFTAITAVSVCLTEVLLRMGVRPDGIIGHSLGEVGCAYADGLITAEQAALIAYARGYATSTTDLPPGLMASIGLSAEECQRRLPEDLSIACHNSKNNVTISGPQSSVTDFTETLSGEGVFTKVVATANVAFHSRYIGPAGPRLLKFLQGVLTERRPRSGRWLPSAVPEVQWESDLGRFNSAEYHAHNFLNPVLFRQVLERVPDDAILIEVAPRGLLQAIFRRNLGQGVEKLSLVKEGVEDDLHSFLEVIGKIYNAGGQPDLTNLYPEIQKYPVSTSTPLISSWVQWDHEVNWTVPGFNPESAFGDVVTIDRGDEKQRYLDGHVVDGRVIYPATGYVFLAWTTFAKMLGKLHTHLPVVIEDFRVLHATILSEESAPSLTINIFKSSGRFEISSTTSVVASGTIRLAEDLHREFLDLEANYHSSPKLLHKLNTEDFYKELHLRGYDYYGIFRGVVEAEVGGKRALLKWCGNWVTFMDTILHAVVLKEQEGLFVPTHIERFVIDPEAHFNSVNSEGEMGLEYSGYVRAARSGGIEVRGVNGKTIKRRNIEDEPTMQKYCFVPENTSSVSPSIENGALCNSLTIALQIVIENTVDHADLRVAQMGDSVSMIELARASTPKSSLRKASFKVLPIAEETTARFDLLLTPDLSKCEDSAVLSYAKSSKFIFSQVSSYDENFFKLFELETVFKQGPFTLFRLTRSLPEDYTVITATGSNFKWVEELKTAISNVSSCPESRIYLVNEDNDSGIIGFFHCLRLERSCPQLRVFYMKTRNVEEFSVRSKFYSNQLRKDLTINVYYEGSWGTYRLLPQDPPLKLPVTEAIALSLTRGGTSGLQWVQKPTITSSNLDQKVEVYFASVTQWDVEAINSSPDREVAIGVEYSGVDQSGKRIMGLVQGGAMTTSVISHPFLTWTVPGRWSLEEAATVPAAYTLACHALSSCAKPKTGHTILVLDASSDIGIAATGLALNKSCTVFAITTTAEDRFREFFPKIPGERVVTYGSNFDCAIMKLTKGRGVDVVLNCSRAEEGAGVAKTALRCLSKGITSYVYIGGDSSALKEASAMTSSCQFLDVTLEGVFKQPSSTLVKLSAAVEELISTKTAKPLPFKVFDKYSLDEAAKSLSAADPSKPLIKIRSKRGIFSRPDNRLVSLTRSFMDPKKCYVIVGGLGGFGLELADWLICRGATKLVLNSRRNVHSGYQELCLQKWRKRRRVVVLTDTSDTTSLEGAEKLLSFAANLGAIGGIFNLAMVLRDEAIENQTVESFKEVVAPKLCTSQNLDFLSRKLCGELEYFVVFSSMVSSMGNANQSNYGFANSSIEMLCESRKSEGLPALAVQWGPVGDVGFVARLNTTARFLEAVPQGITSCLNSLDQFLQQPSPVVSSCVYKDDDDPDDHGGRARNKKLVEAVAGVFGIRNMAQMDESTAIVNLGMDSLLGFEIRHLLLSDFGVDMAVKDIRSMTIGGLRELEKRCGEAS